MAQQRAHWSGRLAFVLAAVGSAVGLGNIWKFPYITGVNGGGAFVLIYLFCIAMVGIPIFIAELYIGQKSQKNVVESFEVTDRKGTPWRATGWMGLLSAFLILSFYSVVGGWILDFVVKAASGAFSSEGEDSVRGLLGGLFSDPVRQVVWHFVFMALTIGTVLAGVKNGIERASKILMPILFGLLAVLFLRSLFLPGFGEAVEFLFMPHTEQLTGSGVLEAVGHSFFTLSLGMGAMITYGSYLGTTESLPKIAVTVALLDTLVALAAGVVIFSIVFSFGLEPGAGPGLMFQTLPVLFGKMNGGYFVGLAFFVLVGFAAFTSAISLLEVVVAYWEDTHKVSRLKTALVSGTLIFLLGILSALSTNVLGDFTIFGLTFFDLFDKLTSNYLLPIGGMLISLFFGWRLGPTAVVAVLGKKLGEGYLGTGLLWSARVLAPGGVAAFLIYGLSK